MISKGFSFIAVLVAVGLVLILGGSTLYFVKMRHAQELAAIDDFDKCVSAGYRVLTTYPPICHMPDGRQFVRNGNVGSSTPPTEGSSTISTAAGTIKGKVNVGPICPVERVDVPCPVPQEAYTSRTIIIYKADSKTEVTWFHINADGTYKADLPAGDYVLGLINQGGVGGAKDLPHPFKVIAGETVEFDFSIDTGIR